MYGCFEISVACMLWLSGGYNRATLNPELLILKKQIKK
jgi:hypothetical protein